MTPEQARELLGGLAAGILTPEERRTLFEAALHDQTLFNEVADELEFGAFLESPETRAQLANRIEVEPQRRPWWSLRPGWLALPGVLAAVAVVFVAVWPNLYRVAPPNAAPAPQVATESAKKESARASDVPSGPATATMARPMSTGASQTAERQSGLSDKKRTQDSRVSKEENRPERRDEGQAQKALSQSAEPSPSAPLKDGKLDSLRAAAPGQGSAFIAGPVPRAAKPQGPQATSSTGALVGTPSPPVAPSPPPQPAPLVVDSIAGEKKATTASLAGTVHDVTGAAVAGAKVDIVDTSTNTTTHMVTDANGRFVALSLAQNGTYTVAAAAPGFRREQRSITLDGRHPPQIDIPLQVGEMTETVEITAAAPQLPMSQNLTQVAILDFANGSEQSQSGAQVADLLSNQLLNGGQVGVIDRDKIQQAALNQAVTGRAPNAKEAAALGRSVGADAVIVGRVQASGNEGAGSGLAKRKVAPNVLVTAEVFDTKQAKPMVKAAANGASLQGATQDLGNLLQSKLARAVEGSVTHLTGDIVSVKFVEAPGLQIGARCDVIRGTRKIGELLITSLNGQYALGKFSGTGRPREGDRVTASR